MELSHSSQRELIDLGVSLISSSLGAGAPLWHKHSRISRSAKPTYLLIAYLLPHFILPIPFPPTLFGVQRPSVERSVQLHYDSPCLLQPPLTHFQGSHPFLLFHRTPPTSAFFYLFVSVEVSLMCTFRN